MTLQELIERAESIGAFEILLAPDSTPRARKKNEWVPVFEQILTPAETRKQLFSLLNDEQRKTLLDTSEVECFWSGSGQRVFCQVQISSRGFVGYISWIPEAIMQKAFWGFPKWTDASLSRGRGIHLMVAKNRLHLEAAAASLVEEINQSKQKMIYWQKQETLSSLVSHGSVVSYGTQSRVPEACDIYVCEGVERLSSALDQAERGRSVLLLIQNHHLAGAFSSLAVVGSSERLAAQFQWGICVKILNGMTEVVNKHNHNYSQAEKFVPVFDLVAGVEPIKQLIRTQKTAEIDLWLDQAQSSDQARSLGYDGMRSMNQGLLQMVLKRKIELRQGFEESPAPESLDLLLKKVGF